MDMSYFIDPDRPFTEVDIGVTQDAKSRIKNFLFDMVSTEDALAIDAHLNTKEMTRCHLTVPDYMKGQQEIYEAICQRNHSRGVYHNWSIFDDNTSDVEVGTDFTELWVFLGFVDSRKTSPNDIYKKNISQMKMTK